MTSLAEAYAEVRGRAERRFFLGAGLFGAGTLAVIVGIIFATTDVLAGLGIGTLGSRKLAGLLAGLGVPAVFIGIFSVLPAQRQERAGAAIGAAVAVLGVSLFWHAYPTQWYGATPDHLTLPVVAIYFLGTLVTFWALFTAVVNFRTRNKPGGTIRIERTTEGETRVVRVPADAETSQSGPTAGSTPAASARGSVGVVGSIDQPTGGATTPTSDGGTDAEVLSEPEPRSEETTGPSGPTDRYCGTCRHFDYRRGGGDIKPYCAFHDHFMDDMDPCESWAPNVNAD